MKYNPDIEWCRHYTGLCGPGMVEHKTCAAGVEYASVKGPRNGEGIQIPCLGAGRGLPCEKRNPLTEVEHEAAERALQTRIDGMVAAMAAIPKLPETAGVIECPACHGRLHWGRARTNGHVHARCETAGCLAWMQ